MQILAIFLILYSLYFFVNLYLDFLNLKHIDRHRLEVPSYFKEHFDKETYAKSISYTRTRGRFGIIADMYSAVLTLAVVLTGFLGLLEEWTALLDFSLRWHGVAYVMGLSLLFTLAELPLSVYRTFVIEERFGFNKTTPKIWCVDLLKGLLLQVIIMAPLLWALFWFIDTSGGLWWLYAFVMIAVVQLTLQYIFPVLIAPLFNKFTPLPDGGLKDKILTLSDRLSFNVSGIFVMDGSKRTAHANAYFTGFGRNKRIVLYDTLINMLSEDQVVAVLAHEIGHEKKRHVLKMTFLSLAFLLLGLWILSLLLPYQPLYSAFGFSSPSAHAGLVIFSLFAGPLGFFISPLSAILSRRHEYEADEFAVKAVSSNQDLSRALLTLSKKSLSNLTPHPVYSFFHYSHPTLLERLQAMEAIKA
ncbi:MAG: M48 family metallopeptidase [Deltaproteobacteria bacterium]|nr:M48 family metallopeptidase [Deltaproteobacteria bacterium]